MSRAGPIGITVLLVEDDAGVRKLLATILCRRGYAVIEAHSGKHALHVLEKQASNLRLQAMVVDVGLPELNGLALCQEIAKLRPDMRVLFITGLSDENWVLSQNEIRAMLLRKPFTPTAFCQALEEILAEPEHRAAAVCAD